MSSDSTLSKRFTQRNHSVFSFLEADPDREKFEIEYKNDLRRQARTLQYPGAFLGMFVWLGFAFGTDQKLHPEFPELFYFRIGFSIIGLLFLFVLLLDSLFKVPTRKYSLGYAYIFISYLIFSTSFFTGRIADDPNYVSGLQIVVISLVFVPLPRRSYYIFISLSMLIFVSAILLYGPNIGTPQAAYSLQNLGIAYLIAFVFSIILERYRFVNFVSQFKILERNREISEKMEQIQTLKEKQDGDYFLTSLLISPLMKSEESLNGSVRVEFLLDQYKKFSFKNKEYELGGDYLSSYEIELRGKKYTAFINGDAMGKSIQGAGGALVLGSVFNSIISRTRLSPEIQSRSPERWLKETFIDLQNVFETFDGFMLVSAILGMVDHFTGAFYYINAEHPAPILYRDHKAIFLGAQSNIRKIGIADIFGSKIVVQTFRLLPNDTVFCGSDGKDDLVLEEDFSGKRIINEDETIFLNSVEESDGDLERIRKSLLRRGKLSDDLSLLSVSYSRQEHPYSEDKTAFNEADSLAQAGDVSTAFQVLKKSLSKQPASGVRLSPLTAKLLSKLYERMSRFEKSAVWAETYLNWDPSDTDFLFSASLVWKKAFSKQKDQEFLKSAIELGERLRIREPIHLKNLINLADMYRHIGNIPRAKKLIEEAGEIAPEDTRVADLKNKLDLLP